MLVLNYNAKRGPCVCCTATLTNIYRNCHFVVPKSTPPSHGGLYEISGGSKPTFCNGNCVTELGIPGGTKNPSLGRLWVFSVTTKVLCALCVFAD